MPVLSLRIDFGPKKRIGPGKIRLLEHIGTSGSISAAARAMDMSYKHAWDLIEEMNRLFGRPLVHTQTGGREGGGARLTAVGRTVVARFRTIERTAAKAAHSELEALEAEISPT
jgi:molybdate transport system regulatory protein